MTTVGILQPVYLPWLGYFEQMARTDHFVFLDDVQYTHQDWRNRNRIKTATGPTWLTVPIRRCPLHTPICEVEINDEHGWQRRHLRTIEQNYGKCRHFQPFFDDLASELRRAPRHLADLDCRLIHLLCRYLEIETPTSRASTISPSAQPAPRDRQERLIDLCRHFGATRFYEGRSGRSYIDVDLFEEAGIEVVFQEYRHPSYRQAFGEFVSHQSAIDLVMNTGPEAPAILRSSPPPAAFRRGAPGR